MTPSLRSSPTGGGGDGNGEGGEGGEGIEGGADGGRGGGIGGGGEGPGGGGDGDGGGGGDGDAGGGDGDAGGGEGGGEGGDGGGISGDKGERGGLRGASLGAYGGKGGGEWQGTTTEALACSRVQCAPPSMETRTSTTAPSHDAETLGAPLRSHVTVYRSTKVGVPSTPSALQRRPLESWKPRPCTPMESGSSHHRLRRHANATSVHTASTRSSSAASAVPRPDVSLPRA